MTSSIRSLALFSALIIPLHGYGGHQLENATESKDAKNEIVQTEKRSWLPDTPLGLLTVGTQFSEKLSGGDIDAITGSTPASRGIRFFSSIRVTSTKTRGNSSTQQVSASARRCLGATSSWA